MNPMSKVHQLRANFGHYRFYCIYPGRFLGQYKVAIQFKVLQVERFVLFQQLHANGVVHDSYEVIRGQATGYRKCVFPMFDKNGVTGILRAVEGCKQSLPVTAAKLLLANMVNQCTLVNKLHVKVAQFENLLRATVVFRDGPHQFGVRILPQAMCSGIVESLPRDAGLPVRLGLGCLPQCLLRLIHQSLVAARLVAQHADCSR
jgi:hypothetical protein